MKEPLHQLVESLSANPVVDALILYGGVIRGRYQPTSDVNLLILLRDTSGPALASLEIP